jgi:DNA-binding protein H-NS
MKRRIIKIKNTPTRSVITETRVTLTKVEMTITKVEINIPKLMVVSTRKAAMEEDTIKVVIKRKEHIKSMKNLLTQSHHTITLMMN